MAVPIGSSMTTTTSPIRSHILTLAHKRTRECLRHEHCEMR